MFRIALAAIITSCGVALTGCTVIIADQAAPTSTPAAAPVVQTARIPTADDRFSYLSDLRNHGVPISVTGDPEVLIATGVCNQLTAGADRGTLINDLNATLAPLAGINAYYYATDMVDAATRDYCQL